MKTVRGLEAALAALHAFVRENPCARIAIDGRCAAGKTTLAARFAAETGAALFHMDDFFLRPAQRTPARYAQPGGNIDHERFLDEVLQLLCRGEQVIYRPFDCASQTLKPAVTAASAPLAVVEGSYALHPALRGAYDLRVFVTARLPVRLARLRQRDPARVGAFVEKWIPLEERYFAGCAVEACCDMLADTSDDV